MDKFLLHKEYVINSWKCAIIFHRNDFLNIVVKPASSSMVRHFHRYDTVLKCATFLAHAVCTGYDVNDGIAMHAYTIQTVQQIETRMLGLR